MLLVHGEVNQDEESWKCPFHGSYTLGLAITASYKAANAVFAAGSQRSAGLFGSLPSKAADPSSPRLRWHGAAGAPYMLGSTNG